MSLEPTAAPSKEAPQISATSLRPAKCCGRRPGLERFALILETVRAVLEIADSAADMRKIWPPPSNMLPELGSALFRRPGAGLKAEAFVRAS